MMKHQIQKTMVMGLVLPALMLGTAVWMLRPEVFAYTPPVTVDKKPGTTQFSAPPTTCQSPPTVPVQTLQEPIMIQVVKEEQLSQMELEEYLLGVMLAEVPAKFQTQALMAQAVAARTYTLMCCTQRKTHTVGAVCMDSSCCQAYISPETYILRGGKWSDLENMRKALENTNGQVLTFDGKLIVATYFSCSGGSTEDAKAVWGADYPYLQAVESPGEEIATFYEDEKIFTPEEIMEALGVSLEGKPQTWFGPVEYTAGGGVKTMDIGGVSYRGTTLRTLLDLRSTAFSVSFHDGFVFFKTKGYGHRVGMSQYGAEAMARRGASYLEILMHYYQGTGLEQYSLIN